MKHPARKLTRAEARAAFAKLKSDVAKMEFAADARKKK